MTRAELFRRAAAVGLLVRTLEPGDGAMRYRFFWADKVPENQSYFGPRDGIHTAKGLRRASDFVAGVEAGRGG